MSQSGSQKLIVMLLAFLLVPDSAVALVGDGTLLQPEWQNQGKALIVHPLANLPFRLSSHSGSFDRSLSDLRSGRTDLQNTAAKLLRDQGLHPMIRLQFRDRDQSFRLRTSPESHSIDFYLGKFRFCEYGASAHLSSQRMPVVTGYVPQLRYGHVPSPDDWGHVTDAMDRFVDEHTWNNGAPETILLLRQEPCLLIDQGEAIPVWEMTVSLDGLPYFVWAAPERLYHWEPRFFSAIGRTKAYRTNPLDGKMTYVTIGNLIGDGTLTSDTFEIINRGAAKARSCTHEFYYEPQDPQFYEASAMTHVTKMLDWYKVNFGFNLESTQRMQVRIREVMQGDVNNAMYIPADASASGKPQIVIGTGDGRVLQNLVLDADVISHEFGHHVVYRSVKHVSGDSLVIHEGLSDFFTFARTGNPCLGPSLCPEGSPICEVAQKCLRTAENDYKFGKFNPAHLGAHRTGQFISGMLWDLHTEYDMAIMDVAKIVYKAIDFLNARTSYEELVVNLVAADNELFEGKHCSNIVASATNRGLGSMLDSLKCKDAESIHLTDSQNEEVLTNLVLATSDDLAELGDPLTNVCMGLATRKKVSSDEWWQCGTVSTSATATFGSLIWLMALLITPLGVVWHRHR